MHLARSDQKKWKQPFHLPFSVCLSERNSSVREAKVVRNAPFFFFFFPLAYILTLCFHSALTVFWSRSEWCIHHLEERLCVCVCFKRWKTHTLLAWLEHFRGVHLSPSKSRSSGNWSYFLLLLKVLHLFIHRGRRWMTACFLHSLLPAPVVALVKYVNSINTTTSQWRLTESEWYERWGIKGKSWIN